MGAWESFIIAPAICTHPKVQQEIVAGAGAARSPAGDTGVGAGDSEPGPEGAGRWSQRAWLRRPIWTRPEFLASSKNQVCCGTRCVCRARLSLYMKRLVQKFLEVPRRWQF